MCLCNGTGKIVLEEKGIMQWSACPDTKCDFDKVLADEKWLKFKSEIKAWKEKVGYDDVEYRL